MITQVPAIVAKLGIMKESEERSIISNGEINEHHSPYCHRIIGLIPQWKNQLENRVLHSHMTQVTCRLDQENRNQMCPLKYLQLYHYFPFSFR